jgi:hypothetical protein
MEPWSGKDPWYLVVFSLGFEALHLIKRRRVKRNEKMGLLIYRR